MSDTHLDERKVTKRQDMFVKHLCTIPQRMRIG